MNETDCDRMVILADESADWKIAGLCQLDRLVLAVNEFAGARKSKSMIDIFIWWHRGISSGKQRLPNKSTLNQCAFVSCSMSLPAQIDAPVYILGTRLLLKRRGLAQYISTRSPIQIGTASRDETELCRKGNQSLNEACNETSVLASDRLWRCLADEQEIGTGERWLLRGSGKSDDGTIARFLHRPISRAISRRLLRTKITPNEWSIWTMTVPLIGCSFIWRGTYAGFVVGAALYQFHNVLDGCDGEIARAKYLESTRGRQIDAFGDLSAAILMALSMGIGLFRFRADLNFTREFHLAEGFVTALLLSLQWLISHQHHTSFGHLSSRALGGGKAKPASGAIDDSRRTILAGARWLLIEVTKRDVSHLFFLLLAIVGLGAWILHFLFAYAAIGFGLTVRALSAANSSSRSKERSLS